MAGPSSRVIMWTSLLLTAKCTSAPLGKDSSGSAAWPLGRGLAVEAVLVDRVADALREVGLQLDRGHRHAVEEQHEVDAVLVVQRVAHLPHHAQPVGGVAGEDVGVHRQRRLELRPASAAACRPEQLDAVAQHVERAALVELIAQAGQQRLAGLRAVVLVERLPRLRLRGLHPGQHIGREERPRAVVARGIALGVEPAVGGEVLRRSRPRS